jgi:hypothetical protein
LQPLGSTIRCALRCSTRQLQWGLFRVPACLAVYCASTLVPPLWCTPERNVQPWKFSSSLCTIGSLWWALQCRWVSKHYNKCCFNPSLQARWLQNIFAKHWSTELAFFCFKKRFSLATHHLTGSNACAC